ncbi:uncharacterized protein LOC126910277 isoform X2 [Daktulosphaira vitifoliae]|nr:uncharacterized protein LOC126910277 isoform X2 [Daktulosphaira vitifoliae]XP_050548656.1 uncharacterized protein LOC126910277 isoform X2 [Daktulosphaira vitifoliae]
MLYFLSCTYNRHAIHSCFAKCLAVLSCSKNIYLKMSSVWIIAGMHIFWSIVFFVNSIAAIEPAFSLLLQAQDFVCFIFEMQFYVLLMLIKYSLEMITNRISDFILMIKENQVGSKLILPDYMASCFEDTRLLQMEVYEIMVSVNKIYGYHTFAIIIKSRILFTMNLYSYITSSDSMELLESIVTFQRIALLCYCSELIKRNEKKIKSVIIEMDINLLPEKYYHQTLLFNHQVEKLNFDFEACEMFPINLETFLSIVITTASYLLLFSQLNISF